MSRPRSPSMSTMDLPPERRKAQFRKPESPIKKVIPGLEQRGEARAVETRRRCVS